MDRGPGVGDEGGQRFDSTSAAPAELARPRRPVLFLVLLLGTTALLWVAAAARQLALARATPLALRGADPQLARGYLDCREGSSKLAPEQLRQSVDCFTQLVTQHPGFAPAYVGLADTYQLLREYGLMPDGEAFSRTITAARKAVELDPASSLGHRALAVAAFHWSFDVPTAEREWRTALALDPEDAEAHRGFARALMLLGRHAEAMAEIDRARALEPASSAIAADRALILHRAGRTDEALGLLTRLARTEPELISVHRNLQAVDFERGEYAASLSEERSVAELLHDAGAVAAVTEEVEALESGGTAAFLDALRVRRLARYQRGSGGAYPLAQVEALRARRELALAHLEEACAAHEPSAMGMRIDAAMVSLHGEIRFRNLLARLGLPEVE